MRHYRSWLLALAHAVLLLPSARAENPLPIERPVRIYLMRGYGGTMTSSGIDEIGRKLQKQMPERPIMVGNWEDWEFFVADALANRAARVVLVGFSKGSEAAAQAAGELASRQIRVKVIGLDPFCMAPVVARLPEIEAINFYRNSCGSVADGTMAGAENVRLGDTGSGLSDHLAVQHDPAVQALVVEAALGGASDDPTREKRAQRLSRR
ncbi:hypothetical protein [Methylobacterium tarhaniae]